jgi:hypothetical protein
MISTNFYPSHPHTPRTNGLLGYYPKPWLPTDCKMYIIIGHSLYDKQALSCGEHDTYPFVFLSFLIQCITQLEAYLLLFPLLAL